MIVPNNSGAENYFAVPDKSTAEELAVWKAGLAKLSPGELLLRMFQALSNAGGQLCAYGVEHLEALLERLNDGAMAKAMQKCPCAACKMRAEYVTQAAPILIAAMKQIAALHRTFEPRARVLSERKQRKDEASAAVGGQLLALKHAGKLGLS